MYDYDRTKVAESNYGNPSGAYANRLESLQATFTGEVAEQVFNYINTLHKRLRSREPYSDISGFLSWDWGSPKQLGDDKWGIRVWQKDASTYPGELAPNVYITVKFDASKVTFEAKAGSDVLVDKSATQMSSSSRSIGMAIGEAWEKKLTGTVDYGD